MASLSQRVDYSQWQRKRKDTQVSKDIPNSAAEVFSFPTGTYSVGSDLLSRVGSACSLSKCNHPWNNFKAIEAARNAREQKRSRMKEINVKIRMQEKTLAEIKARQAELIRDNLKLYSEIESSESSSIEEANAKLRSYEKSRDAIQVMKIRFERQRRELQMEVTSTKRKLDSSIAKLKSEVDSVVQQVKDIYEELALLNNYKDKVYPERLVVIHQLKQKLSAAQLNNELLQELNGNDLMHQDCMLQSLQGFGEEEAELLHIIQTEHKKLIDGDRNSIRQMQESVAAAAMSELHPSIVSMSHENQRLQVDVEFHRSMNQQLQSEIEELQADIDRMRGGPGKTATQILFPSLFKKQEKCTPDTELVFDIPKQKLPVI